MQITSIAQNMSELRAFTKQNFFFLDLHNVFHCPTVIFGLVVFIKRHLHPHTGAFQVQTSSRQQGGLRARERETEADKRERVVSLQVQKKMVEGWRGEC